MSYRKLLTLVAMLPGTGAFGLAARSAAEPVEAGAGRHGPLIEESLGASVNHLGLQNVLGVRWTRPLGRSKSPLLADAHLSAGLAHVLTPSYTRVTAWAEAAPLSILALRAGVEPGVYFGSFGSLMSFASYHDDFGDRVRSARKSEARSGTGARLFAEPTLRAALGGVALVSSATLEWWTSSASGPLFYEPSRDTLLKRSGDRLLAWTTVLVRRQGLAGGGRLSYGLIDELTQVLDAPANRSHRVGLVLARQLAPRQASLPVRSLAVRVEYCLEDPTRKGQLTAAVGVNLQGRE